MGKKRKKRRQPHGSARFWKQTGCWYYTRPGTKKRVPLFDENGERIRGKGSKEAAELALAKEKVSWEDDISDSPAGNGHWVVARVCSDYLQYCQWGVSTGSISKGHCSTATGFLSIAKEITVG